MGGKTIGIVGHLGMVGTTLHSWFPQAKGYDIKEEGKLEDVADSDLVFICIYLVENGRTEEDKATLDKIIQAVPDGRVIVFKSTLVPGTTDYFQEKYPDKMFIHNPEFLSEATAQWDFENPPTQIVGCTAQSIKVAQALMDALPDAPVKSIVSARDAEMYKHLRNSYLAAKVILFNQFYDICENLGVHYDTLRQIFIQDPWIAATHTEIFHKGYRGYGGKCLPKDVENMLEICKDNDYVPELFQKIHELNEEYVNQKR